MTARELRIGNLLRSLVDNDPIPKGGIFTVDYVNNGEIKNCEGIPFSDDWLNRFGQIDFDKDSLHISFGKIDVANQYNLSERKNPNDHRYILFINGGLGEAESYGARIEIKYVHQLQNIYFALTGEELKYEHLDSNH